MAGVSDMKTKTSRILSVYHLFLNCEEVSFQEFCGRRVSWKPGGIGCGKPMSP